MDAPRALHVLLVVTCTSADGRTKRLQFPSVADVSYPLLRSRIARSLQLYDDWSVRGSASSGSSFDISYTDDDGEVCDVACEEDLLDALAFFSPSFLWHALQQRDPSAHVQGSHSVEIRLSATMRVAFALSDWGTDILSSSASLQSHSTLSSFAAGSSADGRPACAYPFPPARAHRAPAPFPASSASSLSSSPSSSSYMGHDAAGPAADAASLTSSRRRVRFSAEIQPGHDGDNGSSHPGREDAASMSIAPSSASELSGTPSLLSLDLGAPPIIQPSPWGKANVSGTPFLRPPGPPPIPPRPDVGGDIASSLAHTHAPWARRQSLDQISFDDGLSQLGHRSDWGIDDAESARCIAVADPSPSTSPLRRRETPSLRAFVALSRALDRRKNAWPPQNVSLLADDDDSGEESDDTVSHKSPARRQERGFSYLEPLPPRPISVFARYHRFDSMFLRACQRTNPTPSLTSNAMSAASSSLTSPPLDPQSYTCSQCSSPLGGPDGFGLRYVCDLCGPRRDVFSSSSDAQAQARPSSPASSSTPPSHSAPSLVASGLDSTYLSSRHDEQTTGFELCASCVSVHGLEHSKSQSSLATTHETQRPFQQRWHAFYELMWNSKYQAWLPIENDFTGACVACSSTHWSSGQYRCTHCDGYVLCGSCFPKAHQLHTHHLFTRTATLVERTSSRDPLQAQAEPLYPRAAPTGHAGRAARRVTDAVHTSVACASCGQCPIVGVRVHCISCPDGRDFCSVCDERGLCFQPTPHRAGPGDRGSSSRYLPPHTQHHICLKLTLPLDKRNAQTTAGMLEEASVRLKSLALQGPVTPYGSSQSTYGSESVSSTETEGRSSDGLAAQSSRVVIRGAYSHQTAQNSSSVASAASFEPGAPPPFTPEPSTPSSVGSPLAPVHTEVQPMEPHLPTQPLIATAARCCWCGKSFAGGIRYLCSHCDMEPTGGYSLCQSCEPYSLLVHDPRHVFLKINRSHSNSPLMRPPTIPPLYDMSAVPPEVDSPLAKDVWDAVLATSGQPAPQALPLLNPLLQHLDPDHPLCAKTHRILDLRRQLGDLMLRWGSPIALGASPAALSGPDSLRDNETLPETLSETGYPPPRRLVTDVIASHQTESSISTPDSDQTLNQTVNALLTELSIVPPNKLIHAFILCDSCFEMIEGAWLRCANCIESVDLCVRCEMRVDHDASHVLAVFKQSVDAELIKSLVHQHPSYDPHDSQGPTRAILPGNLFGP